MILFHTHWCPMKGMHNIMGSLCVSCKIWQCNEVLYSFDNVRMTVLAVQECLVQFGQFKEVQYSVGSSGVYSMGM